VTALTLPIEPENMPIMLPHTDVLKPFPTNR